MKVNWRWPFRKGRVRPLSPQIDPPAPTPTFIELEDGGGVHRFLRADTVVDREVAKKMAAVLKVCRTARTGDERAACTWAIDEALAAYNEATSG